MLNGLKMKITELLNYKPSNITEHEVLSLTYALYQPYNPFMLNSRFYTC